MQEEYKKAETKIAILRVGAREDDTLMYKRAQLAEPGCDHGILIFRPLPAHLDTEEISRAISLKGY